MSVDTLNKQATKILRQLDKYPIPDPELTKDIRWFLKKLPDTVYDEGASFIANSNKNFGPMSEQYTTILLDSETVAGNGGEYPNVSSSLWFHNATNDTGYFERPRVVGFKFDFYPSYIPDSETVFEIHFFNPEDLGVDSYGNIVYLTPSVTTRIYFSDCEYIQPSDNYPNGYYTKTFQITNANQNANNVVYKYDTKTNTITELVDIYAAIKLGCYGMATSPPQTVEIYSTYIYV